MTGDDREPELSMQPPNVTWHSAHKLSKKLVDSQDEESKQNLGEMIEKIQAIKLGLYLGYTVQAAQRYDSRVQMGLHRTDFAPLTQ
jgi:hypothetical protein